MTYGLDTTFLVAIEVACHPNHAEARAAADALRQKGERFAITPQVLSEFIHVVSDGRRFTAPLTIEQAIARAGAWWDAEEVDRVWPDESAVSWFLRAMTKHRLGRKRVLDTLLAGTFHSAGITSLLTLNVADFEVFGEFNCASLDVTSR